MSNVWLSVSMRLTAKGLPKSYRGLRGENWSFAKDKAVDFPSLMYAIILTVHEMYCAVTGQSAEDANADLDKLRKMLSGLKCEEVPIEDKG